MTIPRKTFKFLRIIAIIMTFIFWANMFFMPSEILVTYSTGFFIFDITYFVLAFIVSYFEPKDYRVPKVEKLIGFIMIIAIVIKLFFFS